MSLTKSILDLYKNQIESISIIPSSGGVFEVLVGDDLIYSKKELKRFPEANEVEDLLKDKL